MLSDLISTYPSFKILGAYFLMLLVMLYEPWILFMIIAGLMTGIILHYGDSAMCLPVCVFEVVFLNLFFA